MLTVQQARAIAADWRPRFADPEAFVTSWTRYMEHYRHNRSPESLEAWLRGDAEQDEVRSVGLLHAPTENAPQDLPDIVDDCLTCRGKRLVRRDLPVGHPDFGKLLVCPGCNGRPTYRTIPPREPESYRCWKCGQLGLEAAGEACTNPRWHLPNANLPAPPPVPGWKRLVP